MYFTKIDHCCPPLSFSSSFCWPPCFFPRILLLLSCILHVSLQSFSFSPLACNLVAKGKKNINTKYTGKKSYSSMQMIQYYIQNQHENISSFPITSKESTKIGILEPGFHIEKKNAGFGLNLQLPSLPGICLSFPFIISLMLSCPE